MEDIVYKIALTLVNGIGNQTIRRVVESDLSAKDIFSKKCRSKPKIFTDTQWDAVVRFENFGKIEREVDRLRSVGINIISVGDETYPGYLSHCEDKPYVIYSRGDIPDNRSKFIAVVGTRRASNYGIGMVRELVQELALRDYEVVTVSGLAEGIDGYLHRYSLEYGIKTVGVLGTGIESVYPSHHQAMSEAIVASGGSLITEHSMLQRAHKGLFAKRNRIIAGMSDLVVVAESPKKGGSLITADIAHSYSREVCVFPGRVTDLNFVGSLDLVVRDKARLVRDLSDIEEIMGWDIGVKSERVLNQSMLTPKEQSIYRVLIDSGEISVEELFFKMGDRDPDLPSVLMKMEMSGIIELLGGNIIRVR